jgi:hypothetical protein
MLARAQAARRSARVALRFERQVHDYTYTAYVDGNGNGVLARDIRAGIDRRVTPDESVTQQFPGVRFGLLPGVTAIDSGAPLDDTDDPVQIGAADMVSFSPDGAGSSGTLYIRGRRRQFAVRVLGATGRIRTLAFDFVERTWRAQ